MSREASPLELGAAGALAGFLAFAAGAVPLVATGMVRPHEIQLLVTDAAATSLLMGILLAVVPHRGRRGVGLRLLAETYGLVAVGGAIGAAWTAVFLNQTSNAWLPGADDVPLEKLWREVVAYFRRYDRTFLGAGLGAGLWLAVRFQRRLWVGVAGFAPPMLLCSLGWWLDYGHKGWARQTLPGLAIASVACAAVAMAALPAFARLVPALVDRLVPGEDDLNPPK